MNKLSAQRLASDKNKTYLVVIVSAALAIVNFLPLHYANQQSCPGGGTFTTTGITLGLPLAYFRTEHGSEADCPGVYGDAPTRGFSAQALLGDGMLFGLVTLGLNLLLDRRTKA